MKNISLQEYVSLSSVELDKIIAECTEKTLEGRVLEYVSRYLAKKQLGVYTEPLLNYNLYQWYIGELDIHILRIFSYNLLVADKVNISEVLDIFTDLQTFFENKVEFKLLSTTPSFPVNVSIQIVDRNIDIDALNVLLRIQK